MFSIETKEDIEILKELTGFSNVRKINELENRLNELSEANTKLKEITTRQMKIINDLNNRLVTADECRGIISDVIKNKNTTKPVVQHKNQAIKLKTDEFSFAKAMQKKFNKVIVEGNSLIHYTVRNQKMKIPVTTLQLLALMEIYQHRHRKLLNEDAEKICKLYKINQVQFGKVYYNIKEGSFFNTLEEIDKQIRGTKFKLMNGSIHIIDGVKTIDTGIDTNLFNQFLAMYINSNQPYSTVYKLSKENRNINPIHLLTVLRRNKAVSECL